MNSKFTLSNILIAALIIFIGCTSSDPGPAGLTSLVKITQEPTGANCSSGGFKIETGVDSNKNSVLESDEIQNSAYVCNGAKGNDGTSGSNVSNGLTSLIKVTAENKGANCSSGGYRIDTGIDDNSDGVLSATEIDNTIYVCNGESGGLINVGKQTLVLYGDITNEEAAQIIASDLGTTTQQVQILNCTNLTEVDLSKLESATSIRILNNPSLKMVNLSGLKSLIGPLRIEDSPEFDSLNVNALEYLASFNDYETDGSSAIYNTKLVHLSFSALKKVSGGDNEGYSFHIQDNKSLKSVSFPELTEANRVAIYEESLTFFAAPKLTTGTLNLSSSLTTFSLPKFTEGDVAVAGDLISTLSLPALKKGSVQFGGSKLTSFTIPELTDGSIRIYDEGTLISVYLPKLKIVRSVSITAPQLSILSLPTLTDFYSESVGFEVFGKLSSTSVNSILANLVQITPSVTASNITLKMNPAAPPTGQGLIDKSTLEDNGNMVDTN